jgi:hypothetical protein
MEPLQNDGNNKRAKIQNIFYLKERVQFGLINQIWQQLPTAAILSSSCKKILPSSASNSKSNSFNNS